MQRIFSAIGQAFGKRILIFGLMSLLSLSGLFSFSNQSALANTPSNRSSQSEATDRPFPNREGIGLQEEDRQEAYEEATQALNNPKGLDKIYEEDLKVYEKEQPDKGLVESAKGLIKDVTSND